VRIGGDWVQKLKACRTDSAVFWLIADRWGGFFGALRNMLGVENLCTTFCTDPALVEEMMDTIAEYVVAMAGQVLDHVEIDVFGFWEDMGYRNGPLIGPDLVRKYMLPRYKRVVEYLCGRGVKWVCLDSDGRIDTLIPIWLEAGVNLIYPFEVAAGMDVVEMRKRFGKELRMYAGVDKRALARGRGAIDREIQRVRPLIEEGGYIPSVDHNIPYDVSYANFRYYLERLAEALGM
jgi:uroporphyrinogen decarboxylase